VQAFDVAFFNNFGYPANAISALAYDAANLVFRAVEAAGTLDASVVKDRMATMGINGVTGSGPFDGLHNPIKSVVFLKITNNVINPGAHFYANVSLFGPQGYLPLLKR
jgi:branched-chain amino acid transport system substrate-binding protein